MEQWQWGNPLVEGFTNQPQKGFLESSIDAGNTYRRVAFNDIADNLNCTFFFTKEDYNDFRNWYRNDIKQGTIPFLFFDCRYGINRVARLIGNIPQGDFVSKYFKVSLTLSFNNSIEIFEKLLTVNDDYLLIIGNNTAIELGCKTRI